MNFGQNLYNWFLSNAQSLVLMAIVVIGIYLGFKREFSKLIGFLVIALIAVGLVFNVVFCLEQLPFDTILVAAFAVAVACGLAGNHNGILLSLQTKTAVHYRKLALERTGSR